MNSIVYINFMTRKQPRLVYSIYRFSLLEASSYLESVSYTINIPRLLGLYGESIVPPGLDSRDRAASLYSVIEERFIFRLFNSQKYRFHSLDNPSKLQGEGTSVEFVFLLIHL